MKKLTEEQVRERYKFEMKLQAIQSIFSMITLGIITYLVTNILDGNYKLLAIIPFVVMVTFVIAFISAVREIRRI